MSRHTHRRRGESRIVCWSGCVAAGPCDGRSHGGVMYVDTCRCGAERRAEGNGGLLRYGRWVPAADERDEWSDQ